MFYPCHGCPDVFQRTHFQPVELRDIFSTFHLKIFFINILVANGFSGFLAAFWSSLALCPTELVKCRLQVCIQERH